MKIIAEETVFNSDRVEILYLDQEDKKFIRLEEKFISSEVSNEELLQAGFVFVPGKVVEACEEEDEVGDRSFKIDQCIVHFNENKYKIFINKSNFKFCQIHHKMGDEYLIKMGVIVSPELAMQPNTEIIFVVMDRVAYTNFQTKLFA